MPGQKLLRILCRRQIDFDSDRDEEYFIALRFLFLALAALHCYQ